MSHNINGPDDSRPITWERDAGDALQDQIEREADADQRAWLVDNAHTPAAFLANRVQ